MTEARTTRDSLIRSIFATTAAYFFLQCALFSAFAIPAGFIGSLGPVFFGVCIAFHLFLIYMLTLFRNDFARESTGEKFTRMNLANRITLVRVSTLPTLLFLVLAAKEYKIRVPLLVLVVLVFTTDFIDGYISRKGDEVTKAGKMMDSASDYSLLIVLTVVFSYYKLIPAWFFALVLARLGIQVVLIGILMVVHRRIQPRTTFMGKAAVASIMVLYSIKILGLVSIGIAADAIMVVEWLVAAVVAVSVVDKILSFSAALRDGKAVIGSVSDGNDKKRA